MLDRKTSWILDALSVSICAESDWSSQIYILIYQVGFQEGEIAAIGDTMHLNWEINNILIS